MTFFDMAPLGGGNFGIIFFLIFAAIAFVTFKLLKRTVKMAIRIVIVAIILLVAIIGGLALLPFGTSPRPERAPIKTTH